ncbi:ribonuclease [Brevundimonas sp. NPDC090276]|uniref:ribonuclease n=1 Tax=Brevundimonas sp. NPDC090276 TaxID=3363956 RepID=UPI00383A9C0B
MACPESENEEAREAADMGEKPDRGHAVDALKKALEGTDSGSDTRAGSLRGGSASGSEIDPDQDVINEALATEGMRFADHASKAAEGRPSTDKPDDEVDAPTG